MGLEWEGVHFPHAPARTHRWIFTLNTLPGSGSGVTTGTGTGVGVGGGVGSFGLSNSVQTSNQP